MIPVLLLDAFGRVIREVELETLEPVLYVPVPHARSADGEAPIPTLLVAEFALCGDEESYPAVYRLAGIR